MKQEKQIKELAKRYIVDNGKHFKLKKHDPADTNGLDADFKKQAQDRAHSSEQAVIDTEDEIERNQQELPTALKDINAEHTELIDNFVIVQNIISFNKERGVARGVRAVRRPRLPPDGP